MWLCSGPGSVREFIKFFSKEPVSWACHKLPWDTGGSLLPFGRPLPQGWPNSRQRASPFPAWVYFGPAYFLQVNTSRILNSEISWWGSCLTTPQRLEIIQIGMYLRKQLITLLDHILTLVIRNFGRVRYPPLMLTLAGWASQWADSPLYQWLI